jgi:hypothetical protein
VFSKLFELVRMNHDQDKKIPVFLPPIRINEQFVNMLEEVGESQGEGVREIKYFQR